MPDEFASNVAHVAEQMAHMPTIMHNALHLSLSMSPLLALRPKKFEMAGIRRDHLLLVSLNFS